LENINDYEAQNGDGTGNGAVVANPVPANVTKAISRRSALTGRSARGRVFVPGLPDSYIGANENFFSNAPIDLVVDALNEVNTYMGMADFGEVIVSRFSEGVQRPVGVIFNVSEYVATNYRVDTRRDRLPDA
jgi:hypothetical protein